MHLMSRLPATPSLEETPNAQARLAEARTRMHCICKDVLTSRQLSVNIEDQGGEGWNLRSRKCMANKHVGILAWQ